MRKRNTDSVWDMCFAQGPVLPLRPLRSLYCHLGSTTHCIQHSRFPTICNQDLSPLAPMCPPQITQQPSWSSNGSIRFV